MDENKTRTIGVRFTAAEVALVAEKAKAANLKPSTYIRQAAMARRITSPAPEINREAWAALGKLAGNLNQTLHHLNSGRASGVDRVLIKGLFAQVQALRDDLLGRNESES